MRKLLQQLRQRSADLRSAERLWDQQDILSFALVEALIGQFRRIADYNDRSPSVVRILPDHIEERLAHVVGGAIEDNCIGVVLVNQFVYGRCVALCVDFVSEIAQRVS